MIVGQRIHAAGLFMRGDVEGACGLAREAVQLYVPERHRPLSVRFGQDLRAQSLIYLALTQALLGRIDEARALGDEAIAHARSVNHLDTLGYTLFHCGVWLRAILRETDALRRHGAELLNLAGEHRLGFWRALATPELFRLRGRLAAAEGRGALVEAAAAFERALRLAHERRTHLLELRAATDLARWQAAQGQPLEARKMPAPVYGLFTDGADMADVQDARAMLAGLDG